MDKDNQLLAKQIGIVRILFGAYLLSVFIRLLPYGQELFGRNGALQGSNANSFSFLSFLTYFNDPLSIYLFLASMILLCLFFILGIFRRVVSLFLWIGWASMVNRNPLTEDPSLAFTGWLLLAYALIPPGEAITFRKNREWKMPMLLHEGAWLVLGAAYTYSGLAKLLSPSWADGTALYYIMGTSVSNFGNESGLSLFLMIATWLTLVIQISSLPLMLFKKTKWISWSLWVLMHVLSLFTFNLLDVSLAMLIFHLFVIEIGWIKKINQLYYQLPSGKPRILFGHR